MSVTTLAADWLLTPHQSPQRGLEVQFDRESGQILAVETIENPTHTEDGTTFITPGLVNAHTHLELYTDTPLAISSEQSMADWILTVVGENRNRTDAERMQACRKSILEAIKTGTTCVNDITATGTSLETLSQVGMRGIVSPEFFFPFHTQSPDVTGIVNLFQSLQQRFASEPLLSVGISPHSPYNVTPQALKAVLSQIEPALVHTHMAETQIEIDWFHIGASPLDSVHERILQKRFGPVTYPTTPLAYWADQIDAQWVLAHGTYLEPHDFEILAQKQASLVQCPHSNHWISKQWAPSCPALKRVTLGVGTDSRYSSPSLDMRAEARLLQQVYGLSDSETFARITTGSAHAMKLGKQIGQLAAGFKADMVLWHHPNNNIQDPLAAWLSPETTVEAVWINSRMVLER